MAQRGAERYSAAWPGATHAAKDAGRASSTTRTRDVHRTLKCKQVQRTPRGRGTCIAATRSRWVAMYRAAAATSDGFIQFGVPVGWPRKWLSVEPGLRQQTLMLDARNSTAR